MKIERETVLKLVYRFAALIFFIVIHTLMSGDVFAQDAPDPGIRDTLIIEGGLVDSGATTCIVRIWMVTDDSVASYNFPLRWNSINGTIRPRAGNYYYFPISDWDFVHDTVFTDAHFIRQVGINDLNFGHPGQPVYTNMQRVHCWDITFDIDPRAPCQVVTLDTTSDFRNGSLYFGLPDGITGFKPFVAKHPIIYGSAVYYCPYIPGDINGNGSINGSDITFAVNYFTGGGNHPPRNCSGICSESYPFYAAGDVNGDCRFNGVDICYFVLYLKYLVPNLLNCPDCRPA